MHASLDGYVAGPNGEIDWIKYDSEMQAYVAEKLKSVNSVIYGRVTYEMMAAYWPTENDEHAKWINAAPKIVLSRTMQKADWNNTRVIGNNIAIELRKLKQQGSGTNDNIAIIGSAESANYLMRLGLIDEYWIDINPVILGSGKLLFQDTGEMKKLKLVKATAFKSGAVGFDYVNE